VPKETFLKDIKQMIADFWIIPNDNLIFFDKNDLELIDETKLIILSSYNDYENNVFIKVDILP
jgi:hypothetical protein